MFEDRLDGSDGNGLKPFTSVICRRQPLSTCRKCRLLKKAKLCVHRTYTLQTCPLPSHLPQLTRSPYLFNAQVHRGKLTSSSEVVLPLLLRVASPGLLDFGSPPRRTVGHTHEFLAILCVIAASSRLKRQACTQLNF